MLNFLLREVSSLASKVASFVETPVCFIIEIDAGVVVWLQKLVYHSGIFNSYADVEAFLDNVEPTWLLKLVVFVDIVPFLVASIENEMEASENFKIERSVMSYVTSDLEQLDEIKDPVDYTIPVDVYNDAVMQKGTK